jgi:N-acetylglucosamine kinase-like BadF-type ATPase
VDADTEPAVLAVDGGSTKTDAVLVSKTGTVLGRSRVGPSNHQLLGLDGMIDALDQAVASVAADAGIAEAASGSSTGKSIAPLGVFCLAGVDLPVDEEMLAPAIEGRGWTTQTILRNDTFAVSRAGSTAPWGIGVVCGTGINCAGVGPDGTMVRFPALAELSGDFAPGGSWLGVRALGLALRAGDGRGPDTVLRQLVPAHLGQPDAEAVLTGVYTGTVPYNRLFELARVLLDAAADGDQAAREAADILADEVVGFAGAAIRRLGVEEQAVEVVLGGGIFDTRDRGFHDRVDRGIHAVAPKARLVRLKSQPVLGAALIGLDTLGADRNTQQALREALTTPKPAPPPRPTA